MSSAVVYGPQAPATFDGVLNLIRGELESIWNGGNGTLRMGATLLPLAVVARVVHGLLLLESFTVCHFYFRAESLYFINYRGYVVCVFL
jgi:hypothetical protein